MRRVLISTKPFIFVLFLVGVTVRSAESLSSAIPLGTSTKRANSKRANHGRSRCLSSRRCMRSWRSRGWPLSRPEAPRPPPPSSLPSTAGGTWAFPRWRERSRCTCSHETPPLGGTVRVSRPRSVSWQPLSRGWCSHSRGVDAGAAHGDWLRSTSDESHGAVPREGHHVHHGGPGAPSLAQPGRDEGRRQGTLSRRPHLQGRAVRRHRQGLCPAVLGGTAADRGDPAHLPRHYAPSTAAPGARPQSAHRRAPPQAESIPWLARRASRRRAAPPASQPGPKSFRKSTKRPWRRQPGDVGICSFSGDGKNSAAPSPGGGPGGESSVSVPPLVQGLFPFPPGSQVHGTTVCDTQLPHSRPRPILPVAKRVRFGDDIPP